MSAPQDMPEDKEAVNDETLSSSPSSRNHFLIPSPIPTRRNRTYSASEKALRAPPMKGTIKNFCRQRGHGFISPEDGSEPIFVHISDIDGEFVPKEGDEVTFRTIPIPPRMEKKQAAHVVITHLKPGVTHERWDSPVPRDPEDGGMM